MIDENKLTNIINHTELVKNITLYNGRIKDLNKLEYKEYLDLERRNEEGLVKKVKNKRTTGKTQVNSKKSVPGTI